PQQFRKIVEEAAEAGGVAALLIIQTRAAPIDERDSETRLRQPCAGVFVPAAVALDAVNADDLGTRVARWTIAAIAPAVAVASGEGFDGERGYCCGHCRSHNNR